ncbi:MAG: biopolymer transporter ExbD [Spirochaetales bacterium]|nr:biopolymer transporter ExbD [Spirochaetales bacterium]
MVDIRRFLGRQAPFSEINITPFTDIVLVLLIIFMIAAPGLIQSGLDIDLPGAASGKTGQAAELVLTLDRSGQLAMDGQKVDRRDLLSRLEKEVTRSGANLSLVVNADRESSHGRVIEVLDLARQAGVKKIYVGARKREGL